MNYERTPNLQSTHMTPLKNKRSRQLLQREREDTLNLSPILNETSLFKNLSDTSFRQALNDSSIISHNIAGEGLDEAFFEIIQNSRPSDVLDTLERLGRVCCDSLELVEPWNRYNLHNYWLAEEANTWKLLHCLYADSLGEHPESLEDVITSTTLSQQELVNALFKSDSELRLLQLLVDWLEATAAYQGETTKTSAPVIGNNIHWGNTLHQLLIGSSLFNKEKSNMITCMDPDAPRRQKKSIHSDDQQDDNDLCKRIFSEVRCSKFNEAVSLCISAGQAWRGAALQGWRLLHYLPRDDPNANLEIIGNPSRDLWKWCALGIATNVTENVYYRATIGILCGHLSSALPACQGNWEDLLWAHLRIQIEARVDKFLREHYATAQANTTPADVLELLQNELNVDEMSLQQIFGAVNALMDGKKESYYQTCQRLLMLGQIRTIMQESLQWLDNSKERFVRFLAHLVLILRQMGKDPQHDIGNQILEKYVSQLIGRLVDGSVDCPELIAYYTSTVPNERQIVLYAEFLDHIKKSEFRNGVVEAGMKAGIDIAASARVAIKKAITEIQNSYGNVDMTLTQTTVAENSKNLVSNVISSLEWLSLISNQFEEALWLSNVMIRTFIFLGNTEAASHCVQRFKEMFSAYLNKVPSNSSELREHLCLKAYLEALEGFATWYRQFISGQPKDADPLPPNASFADKVHHEQMCAQVEEQRARWKNSMLHQSKHTKSMLYNVLLFPGGWLQDENDSTTSPNFTEEEKKERSKQMETLRGLCIPEAVILILKILQSDDIIENHKEAIKLCDIIAAENRCLYKVFTNEKLVEVLDRVKNSSLLLLEKGRDMFGYEKSDD